MKYHQPEALYQFLSGYLTGPRRALFDQVIKFRTLHFTVAVEDLHKEQNASAVVRSCDCFGIQQLHIIQGANPYKVSSSISRGAEHWVDLKLYDKGPDNSQLCIDELKSRGYRIVATSPDPQGKRINDFDIRRPAAFFFGGEKDGLSDIIFSQADELLTVPLVGFTESLNISVSAAIILYHLTGRLHQSEDIAWELDPVKALEKKIDWAIRTIPRGEQLVGYFYQNEV